VVGDDTAGTELNPSKQLHTASKHSMWRWGWGVTELQR